MEKDRELVSSERLSWLCLSESEKETEQRWLSELWENVKSGVPTYITVDPQWSEFPHGILGTRVQLTRTSFGMANWQEVGEHLRPILRGPFSNGEAPWTWLWVKGFQVAGYNPGKDEATIVVSRLMAESERLVKLLGSTGMSSQEILVTGMYDPVSGDQKLILGNVKGLKAVITR